MAVITKHNEDESLHYNLFYQLLRTESKILHDISKESLGLNTNYSTNKLSYTIERLNYNLPSIEKFILENGGIDAGITANLELAVNNFKTLIETVTTVLELIRTIQGFPTE